MSKTSEELRAARLRALGQSSSSSDAATPAPASNTAAAGAGAADADADAMAVDNTAASVAAPAAATNAVSVRQPTEDEMAEMRALLWPPTATEDDLARWHQQGFVLQETPAFGLAQGHGGPCGVLAAVQSELLRLLIFGDAAEPPPVPTQGERQLPSPSPDAVIKGVAGAMVAILERARPTPREVEEAEGGAQAAGGGNLLGSALPPADAAPGHGLIHLATPAIPDSLPLPATTPTPATALSVRLFSDAPAAVAFVASDPSVLAAYQSPSGVMLFVLSLLMTRGVGRVKNEMDDVGNALTGRFGHCTQELLNLLLVGRAVSNVFDGEKDLGESGLKLRGISARPTVGYLTHLETLRYVQVGSHYKTPIFPIWVVGSTSHFTVLFALDKGCNEESQAEQLLAKAQRAFSAFDPSEGGFIQAADLQQVLIELDLLSVALDERAHERLKSRLEMPGSGGLILWQDFWQAVSQLLTGVSLDDYLSGKGASSTTTAPAASDSTAMVVAAPDATEGRQRSDSDIARELQAQFDAGGDGAGAGMVDDDEAATQALIRQLQEEDGQAAAQQQQQQQQQQPAPPPPSPSGGSAAAPAPAPSSQPQQQALAATASTGAESYTLYHYNGLTGPGGRASRLARFTLTKRASASGALVGGRAIAFGQSPMGSGAAFSCPVEEVLATKWPGARFNWHGEPPPSID